MRNEWRCHACFSLLKPQTPTVNLIIEGHADPAPRPSTHVIVVVHGLHICGAARHCLELLSTFNSFGCFTSVLAPYGGGHWADLFLSNCHELRISTEPSPAIPLFQQADWRSKSGIVSAHYDPAIAWSLVNLPDAQYYAHFHTEPEYGLFTIETLRSAGNICQRVFFPDEVTRGAYCELLHRPIWWDTKTRVMPNSVPSTARLIENDGALRISSPQVLRLGIVSRLDPDKVSLDLLIETLRSLSHRYARGLQVKIAGGGLMINEARDRITRNDLGGCVEFLGWVHDVAHLYRWADVTFLPSRTETMPYAAIESICSGTLVVLPRLGYFATDGHESGWIHTFGPGEADEAATLIASVGRMSAPSGPPGFDIDCWRSQVLKEFGLIV